MSWKAVDVLEFWTMMKLWRRWKIFEQRGTKLSEVFGRFELEIFKVLENWKFLTGGCSTPNLLLTCSSLKRENGHPFVHLLIAMHNPVDSKLDWTVFGNHSKVVQMGRHLAVGGTPEQPITLWHLKPPNWVDMLLKGETCKRESPCGRPPRRQQIATGAPTFNNQTTLERGDEFSENPGKWNPAQHLFFFFVQDSDQSIKSWHLRPHGTYSCTRHGKPSKTVFGDKLDGNPCEKLLPMLDI